jgi:hypothetical protein
MAAAKKFGKLSGAPGMSEEKSNVGTCKDAVLGKIHTFQVLSDLF